jgi:uncharacterized protein YndB with AHSA1/START domain
MTQSASPSQHPTPLTVERSIWINAPRERAWRAVTEAQHLDQWYATGCNWEILTLQVGASVRFFHRAKNSSTPDTLLAVIEVLDPPRQFTLRWQPDKINLAVQLVTSFVLEEENGGTRVTIHESGYAAVPSEECQGGLDATDTGYMSSLENLKALLEGTPLPH